MPYLGVSGKTFEKTVCIQNQRPRICLTTKFGVKKKSLNFGPKMSYLGILGLEFENTIVIFEVCALNFA